MRRGRHEMGGEPVACEVRHLVERARFFEQVRRAGHDHDLVGASKLRGSVLIQLEDDPISPADDQQGWGAHGR